MLAVFEALEIAVFENQKRAAIVFQDRSMVGDDADAFLRIAAVIDEDADQQAARAAFANPHRQVLVELGETSGLQDVGEHVRGDVRIPLLEAPHAVRSQIGSDKGHHDRHHAVA